MITLKEAEFFVIRKMLMDRYIGGHQILSENIPKGREYIKILEKEIANGG